MFPIKKLAKFLLKRTLGNYLKHQLDLEQLDFQLSEGALHLKELELEPQALSALSTDLPVLFQHGYIGGIQLAIPWRNIYKEPCRVTVEDVVIHLTPKNLEGIKAEKPESFVESIYASYMSPDLRASLQDYEEDDDDGPEVTPTEESLYHTNSHGHQRSQLSDTDSHTIRDELTSDGLELLSVMVDRILLQMRCKVDNAQLFLHVPSRLSGTTIHLIITFGSIDYFDEAAMEGNLPEKIDKTILRTKVAKVRGIKVQMSESPTMNLSDSQHDFLGTEERLLASSPVILSIDESCEGIFKIKSRPEKSSQKVPRIDTNVFFEKMAVCLNSRQHQLLMEVLSLFGGQTAEGDDQNLMNESFASMTGSGATLDGAHAIRSLQPKDYMICQQLMSQESRNDEAYTLHQTHKQSKGKFQESRTEQFFDVSFEYDHSIPPPSVKIQEAESLFKIHIQIASGSLHLLYNPDVSQEHLCSAPSQLNGPKPLNVPSDQLVLVWNNAVVKTLTTSKELKVETQLFRANAFEFRYKSSSAGGSLQPIATDTGTNVTQQFHSTCILNFHEANPRTRFSSGSSPNLAIIYTSGSNSGSPSGVEILVDKCLLKLDLNFPGRLSSFFSGPFPPLVPHQQKQVRFEQVLIHADESLEDNQPSQPTLGILVKCPLVAVTLVPEYTSTADSDHEEATLKFSFNNLKVSNLPNCAQVLGSLSQAQSTDAWTIVFDSATGHLLTPDKDVCFCRLDRIEGFLPEVIVEIHDRCVRETSGETFYDFELKFENQFSEAEMDEVNVKIKGMADESSLAIEKIHEAVNSAQIVVRLGLPRLHLHFDKISFDIFQSLLSRLISTKNEPIPQVDKGKADLPNTKPSHENDDSDTSSSSSDEDDNGSRFPRFNLDEILSEEGFLSGYHSFQSFAPEQTMYQSLDPQKSTYEQEKAPQFSFALVLDCKEFFFELDESLGKNARHNEAKGNSKTENQELHNYRLAFEKCYLFFLSSASTQSSQIVMNASKVCLDDELKGLSLCPVLKRTEMPLQRSEAPSLSLDIVKKMPTPSLRETNVQVNLRDTTLHHTYGSEWLFNIIYFLFGGATENATENEIEAKTFLTVDFCDINIDWRPSKAPSAALLTLANMRMTNLSLSKSQVTSYKFILNDFDIFLINDGTHLIHPELLKIDPAFTKKQYLEQMGYAHCAAISYLSTYLRFSDVEDPPVEVEISDGQVNMTTCADSFVTFMDLLMHWANGAELPKPPQDLQEDAQRSEDTHPETSDAMDKIDIDPSENAFPLIPGDSSPNINPSMLSSIVTTNFLDDYNPAMQASVVSSRSQWKENLQTEEGQSQFRSNIAAIRDRLGKIEDFSVKWSQEQKELHLIDNYASIFTEADPWDTTSDEITASPNFRIKIKGVSLHWRMYRGYDWTQEEKKDTLQMVPQHYRADFSESDSSRFIGQTSTCNLIIDAIDEYVGKDDAGEQSPSDNGIASNRTRRAIEDSMELEVKGLHVVWELYPVLEEYSNRLRLSVKELSVLDDIQSSKWKTFLGLMKHEAGTRIAMDSALRFELCCVRPNPKQPAREEYRMKIRIHPLRLNIDQDAMDFLIDFFSYTPPNAPASTESDEKGMYFQFCDMGPITVKADYKPKRINFRDLHDGHYVEAINFFPLEAVLVELPSAKISGVRGWGPLMEGLGAQWFPHIKGQIHKYLLGIQPFRSIANIGSGVADLVMIPMNDYKQTGNLIRGVRRGTSSFLRAVTREALNLGTKLVVGTQSLLEQIDPDAKLHKGPGSKYSEQPADAREGLIQAYASLSRGLRGATMSTITDGRVTGNPLVYSQEVSQLCSN
eukprot:TRINITY_DN2736_c0_g1_i9.p1 TRINITY_DN2736_c0_g1~~TRINITY_DN2736_c0_g1_i9.p1  ORF type:complete len:1818 (-),score=341.60 TRINITY_DN2736_c0_g1_i9:95-5548(-)